MEKKLKNRRLIILGGFILGAVLITEIALAIWLPLRSDVRQGYIKSTKSTRNYRNWNTMAEIKEKVNILVNTKMLQWQLTHQYVPV